MVRIQRRFNLFRTGEAPCRKDVTPAEIRSVRDSQEDWKRIFNDGESGEDGFFRNFQTIYKKRTGEFLAKNPGWDYGEEKTEEAEEDEDDDYIPNMTRNSPGVSPTQNKSVKFDNLGTPTADDDLTRRLRGIQLKRTHRPSLTTMATIAEGNLDLPEGCVLHSTSQFQYQFAKVETVPNSRRTVPFTGVGILVGPVPGGHFLEECPVEVVGGGHFVVIRVPFPRFLLDPDSIVEALNTPPPPPERTDHSVPPSLAEDAPLCSDTPVTPSITPESTRHIGIVSGVANNCNPRWSVYVSELPFRCNQELFSDGDAFPDLRFLNFVREGGREPLTCDITYLHVQLRSFKSVAPTVATASYGTTAHSTVHFEPPVTSRVSSSSASRRGGGTSTTGSIRCSGCAREGSHLCYCNSYHLYFCSPECREKWLRATGQKYSDPRAGRGWFGL